MRNILWEKNKQTLIKMAKKFRTPRYGVFKTFHHQKNDFQEIPRREYKTPVLSPMSLS